MLEFDPSVFDSIPEQDCRINPPISKKTAPSRKRDRVDEFMLDLEHLDFMGEDCGIDVPLPNDVRRSTSSIDIPIDDDPPRRHSSIDIPIGRRRGGRR